MKNLDFVMEETGCAYCAYKKRETKYCRYYSKNVTMKLISECEIV
jgi:hypothetical protein